MKLYATINNEKRKTAGIGGNEILTIEINKGNRRMCELYITIKELANKGGKFEPKELMVIDMLNLSDGSKKMILDYEFYESDKGKQQKDENIK